MNFRLQDDYLFRRLPLMASVRRVRYFLPSFFFLSLVDECTEHVMESRRVYVVHRFIQTSVIT